MKAGARRGAASAPYHTHCAGEVKPCSQIVRNRNGRLAFFLIDLPDPEFCSNLPLQSGSPPQSQRNMASYEPKTDSREFEVANLDGMSGSQPAAIPDPTGIAIRLWGLQGDRGEFVTWMADSVCVFLLSDLVTASGGRPEDSRSLMAAQFENPGQALVCARRIQAALLEFGSAQSSQTVAAAILIHPAAGAIAGLSADTVSGTLTLLKPGQILVEEELARRWSDIPGLEFRTVPVMTSAGIGQPSLVELMWTTAEELERLQNSVPSDPVPQRSSGSLMGATMMVPLSFESPEGTTEAQSSPALSVRDRGPKEETVLKDLSIQQQEGDATTTDLLQDLDASPPFLTRTRMIVGVLALAVVGALVAVLYWPMPESKHTPRAQQTVGGTANPGAATGTSNPPASKVSANPVAGMPSTGPAKSTPPSLPPAPSAQAKPPETKPVAVDKKVATPVVAKPVQAKAPQITPPLPPVKSATAPTDAPAAWSKSDIAQLSRMAQSALGAGRYDDARAAYRKILQLQPENQEAKEGLHKIDLIQKDDN